MGDLISRAKAIAMHKAECSGDCGCCKYITQDLECGILIKVPAVDAVEVVRHGKWEMNTNPNSWYFRTVSCSECSCTNSCGVTPYCPNCGAKMAEEEEK